MNRLRNCCDTSSIVCQSRPFSIHPTEGILNVYILYVRFYFFAEAQEQSAEVTFFEDGTGTIIRNSLKVTFNYTFTIVEEL